MGWDVVQIGLRHNLPVKDPFATAEECSKRLKRNIMLVADDLYRYDERTNTVSRTHSNGEVVLSRVKYDETDNYLKLIAEDYQQRQIIERVGLEQLKLANFPDGSYEQFLDRDHYALYEFLDDEFDVMIFEENIDISVIRGRWYHFYSSFAEENKERHPELLKKREAVLERARLFGCDQVIYCADQGSTEMILDAMDKKADELLAYVKERRYIDDCSESEEEKEVSREGLHIDFSEFVDGGWRLGDEEYINVVFDKV